MFTHMLSCGCVFTRCYEAYSISITVPDVHSHDHWCYHVDVYPQDVIMEAYSISITVTVPDVHSHDQWCYHVDVYSQGVMKHTLSVSQSLYQMFTYVIMWLCIHKVLCYNGNILYQADLWVLWSMIDFYRCLMCIQVLLCMPTYTILKRCIYTFFCPK